MGNIRRYAIYLQSSSLHCNACIDGYLRSNIPCPLPSVPAGIRVGAYAEGNGMDLAMEVLQEELLQKVHKSYDPEPQSLLICIIAFLSHVQQMKCSRLHWLTWLKTAVIWRMIMHNSIQVYLYYSMSINLTHRTSNADSDTHSLFHDAEVKFSLGHLVW